MSSTHFTVKCKAKIVLIHLKIFAFRYKEDGEALLILLPSEEQGMVQQLLQKKVPVKEIK